MLLRTPALRSALRSCVPTHQVFRLLQRTREGEATTVGSVLDYIGPWSELKLQILRKYAHAYSAIMSSDKQRKMGFSHAYIDAFAGPGQHRSKTSGELVDGSPLVALKITPPFDDYYFIELQSHRVGKLKDIVGDRSHVHIYEGDCNEALIRDIYPRFDYRLRRRALCFLDPYGLHLDWKVILTAGQMKTIDLFVNFPLMDINRNALWRKPGTSPPDQEARLTRYWGDESWLEIAYEPSPQLSLLETQAKVKTHPDRLALAFRKRLQQLAGFEEVSEPVPMRNSKGNILYYLLFASHKPVAKNIMDDIIRDYIASHRLVAHGRRT